MKPATTVVSCAGFLHVRQTYADREEWDEVLGKRRKAPGDGLAARPTRRVSSAGAEDRDGAMIRWLHRIMRATRARGAL